MRDWQPVLGLPLWFWLFILPSIIVAVCLVFPNLSKRVLTPIWRGLDKVYLASGVVAAISMVTILLIIVGQMISRWSGLTFQGSTDYAGYAMAATSFFAFAHALNRGAHIRVSILLNMNHHTKRWLDAFAMLIASIIGTYFARYAVKANFESKMLNDRTQGVDQVPDWFLTIFKMFGNWPSKWGEIWAATGSEWVYTPVWLPQIPMSIGTVLLAIALWDNLTRLMVFGESQIVVEAVA